MSSAYDVIKIPGPSLRDRNAALSLKHHDTINVTVQGQIESAIRFQSAYVRSSYFEYRSRNNIFTHIRAGKRREVKTCRPDKTGGAERF